MWQGGFLGVVLGMLGQEVTECGRKAVPEWWRGGSMARDGFSPTEDSTRVEGLGIDDVHPIVALRLMMSASEDFGQ